VLLPRRGPLATPNFRQYRPRIHAAQQAWACVWYWLHCVSRPRSRKRQRRPGGISLSFITMTCAFTDSDTLGCVMDAVGQFAHSLSRHKLCTALPAFGQGSRLRVVSVIRSRPNPIGVVGRRGFFSHRLKLRRIDRKGRSGRHLGRAVPTRLLSSIGLSPTGEVFQPGLRRRCQPAPPRAGRPTADPVRPDAGHFQRRGQLCCAS